MAKHEPITVGTKFGRWTVLEETEIRVYSSGTRQIRRQCRCDCGTIEFVGEYKLRIGHSRSCGCLQSEVTAKRSTKHGCSKRGETTRAYNIWGGILERCENPKNEAYENYGARGITMCDRWHEFANFLEDMGEPPPGLTIDRLNNDKGYFKENCAWRTPKEQARNRRNSIILTYNGMTMTLIEWSEMLDLSYRMLRARHLNGWSTERILTEPKN